MDLVFPITLCFLPLILCIALFCIFFHIKLTHQLIAVLLGFAAILPISIIQFFLPIIPIFNGETLVFVLLKSFLMYGLIEELISLLFLFLLPHKDYSLRDFLLLSFVMGLGLAGFESVIYFLDHLQRSNALGGVLMYTPIFRRMFTAQILHTFCAGLIGMFVYQKRKQETFLSLILIPIFLHGLYDFFAGFQNQFWYFSIAVILFTAIECRVKYSILNPSENK